MNVMLFNDTVSIADIIQHQVRWEDDYEQWIGVFESTVMTFSYSN